MRNTAGDSQGGRGRPGPCGSPAGEKRDGDAEEGKGCGTCRTRAHPGYGPQGRGLGRGGPVRRAAERPAAGGPEVFGNRRQAGRAPSLGRCQSGGSRWEGGGVGRRQLAHASPRNDRISAGGAIGPDTAAAGQRRTALTPATLP
ncbi:hypothetical protein GCM10023336_41230 [Streptomyces similanensis]|uniref:Uncharacterized protein n=1 Tax=Streptomyces similanensis TaxID=1274988 RepID=A0ABP9KS58_9ACTN